MEDELRRAEREWRASPGDDARIARARAAYARAGRDPPWDLLAVAPEWRPVVGFLRKWFARPPTARDGCSPSQLTQPMPRAVREWYLLAGRRPLFRGFSHLAPVGALEAQDGWINIGVGHQGQGRWRVRVDDPDGIVEVRDDDLLHEAVGPAPAFYLAFLLSELCWSGDGRGPWVRQAMYSEDDIEPAVRAGYTPLPTVHLWGVGDDRVAFGDADTVILVVDPEPVLVSTRTEAAWQRALEAFGPPRDEDLR